MTKRRIIYSPLAGCSDYPFRQMAARYKPDLMFCEMVKFEPLVRGNERTLAYLDISEEMHPIGGQIVGSDPSLAGPAAKIIEDLGFDVVDLNCGCPVDKVTKKGDGSGLLRTPELLGEILCNMIAAVKIPVTVKIRAGWDSDSINALDIVKIAEDAGAQMIAIHGRTRAQKYNGFADRDVIRDAKKAAKTIQVAGNGDIFDGESAQHMFDHTNCDAILCSRGTMGQPWIVEDIRRHQEGLPPLPRDPLQALLDHIDLIEAYRNDKRACLDIRRVACWYCKETRGISELRTKLARVSSVDEARTLVQNFRKWKQEQSSPASSKESAFAPPSANMPKSCTSPAV